MSRTLTATLALLIFGVLNASAQTPADDWDHLRIAASPNFSKDPSHYDGPRSSYFTMSWTTDRGTLFHGRFYLDTTIRREVNDKNVERSLDLKDSLKELFVRRTFANGVEVTAGDIRATAHSDNNKVLYSGDGKPLHSTIVEIDRVLGASIGKAWPIAKVELTVADRGRRDLEWSGLMEAIRVSRAFHERRQDVQVTFVNRTGADSGGFSARHQWQAGIGGSIASSSRSNVVSAEYVHANFLPGRTLSTDAFSLAYERKILTSRALSLVADYEHINGDTGVSFYEAGGGLNVIALWSHAYVRTDLGWRVKDPRLETEWTQNGAFVRLALIYDRGKGAVTMPPVIHRLE